MFISSLFTYRYTKFLQLLQEPFTYYVLSYMLIAFDSTPKTLLCILANHSFADMDQMVFTTNYSHHRRFRNQRTLHWILNFSFSIEF